MPGLDLEPRVLWPAEPEPAGRADGLGGNEPSPPVTHEDEESVVPGGIQVLDEPAPTAIPASRAHAHLPSAVAERARCLDLDAQQTVTEVGDQIEVGAVSEGMNTAAPRSASQSMAEISPRSPWPRGSR